MTDFYFFGSHFIYFLSGFWEAGGEFEVWAGYPVWGKFLFSLGGCDFLVAGDNDVWCPKMFREFRECPILTGIRGWADGIRGHDFFCLVLRRGHDFFDHNSLNIVDFWPGFHTGSWLFFAGFPTGLWLFLTAGKSIRLTPYRFIGHNNFLRTIDEIYKPGAATRQVLQTDNVASNWSTLVKVPAKWSQDTRLQ